MKRIAILGSTGSIGVNALDVIASHKDRFRVVGLSANSNTELLSEQIRRFKPRLACIMSREKARSLEKRRGTRVVSDMEGLIEVATHPDVDLVIMAIMGSVSLIPLLEAIAAKKQIALASKEAFVTAGELVMKAARKNNVRIIPIDSEHSAIFQCINTSPSKELKKVYLTGTGGPLRNVPGKLFDGLEPEEVLNHPKWKMGKKISVDSATLMNKGLEVIEAKWLFSLALDQIEILVHPEAVIHSMVEFIDGSILAQLSITDMRLPIQYAVGYPERIAQKFGLYLDFKKYDRLTFCQPDEKKFPCLDLAYGALKQGGTFPAVLNAANEVAVLNYLDRKIKFTDIPRFIEKALSRHRGKPANDINDILDADCWSREEVRKLCCQ
ncbi:MAG: 1-deoxy-D-xylulose-5-phosphate reductoisomerase [Candidatus Omnitrophica bacterium]|nr:1-deoxy-D-xylulose-5-phosphate reductoisomerase [Candidatus Omnitrophota bacterium]